MQKVVDKLCRSGNDENETVVVEWIRRTKGRMLDLGCNDGSLTMRMARRARAEEVHGIEINERLAKLARKSGIRVKVHDLNMPLPYKDNYFDLVTANQVIEHLYFTDDFIREVYRVLAPGGRLVISTTNLAAWHYRMQLLMGQQPICVHPSERQFGNPLRGESNPRYGHKSVFTHRALVEFLEHHGFVIERERTVTVYPLSERWGRWVVKMLPNVGTFATVAARKKRR